MQDQLGNEIDLFEGAEEVRQGNRTVLKNVGLYCVLCPESTGPQRGITVLLAREDDGSCSFGGLAICSFHLDLLFEIILNQRAQEKRAKERGLN